MNKEYGSILKQLSKENRKTIKKMQHYLETCYINEVVFEDLMCDIAGMAMECQERGENFADSIGTDYKSFCLSLSENVKKQSFPERFFEVLKWMVYFVGIIIPFLYVMYAFFDATRPNLSGFVLNAPASEIFMYFSVSTLVVIGFFLAKRFTYCAQTLVIFIYFAAVTGAFVLTDFLGEAIFGNITLSVNLITWGVVILVLLLICQLARRLIATNIAYKAKERRKNNFEFIWKNKK
ncbi:MAG: hypothetical protein E7671_01525 [Ruminococcaceae bacterium]|nr:hypothetical protein [Oscillospiraceae bacterium]